MATEDQGTPTPTTTEAPAQAPAQETTAPAAAATENAQPAWTPDFTYEFDGKKREIDPMFRTVIKDEDSLKKVRDYVQRADASSKYREKMQGYEAEWKPIVDRVGKLQQWFEKGDHERIFKELGYDDETIFKYVKNKLEQAQMPQDQRQLFEAKRAAELEKERLMEENMSYREQASQELARVTDIELDMELAKPQHQRLADAYDKAYGSGAFKAMVIDRGAHLVAQQGQHVRPGQLLSIVARDFAPFMASQPEATEMPAQQPQQTKPKVIPNVGKGSGSPTRTQYRSIADLKKRAQQLGE